ncbi:hypothetical protein N657DRAFT_637480 [Parathielavia appendiculata]|uniref:Uncharacterized protein n=1 Tax=Parathielavia appendiculata TaxID=2587402 RepID=A0AAN6Z077_9PEZI|nr:hypothetical protein N657DRAFT_637480 [Parathielavia appendiculata]
MGGEVTLADPVSLILLTTQLGIGLFESHQHMGELKARVEDLVEIPRDLQRDKPGMLSLFFLAHKPAHMMRDRSLLQPERAMSIDFAIPGLSAISTNEKSDTRGRFHVSSVELLILGVDLPHPDDAGLLILLSTIEFLTPGLRHKHDDRKSEPADLKTDENLLLLRPRAQTCTIRNTCFRPI